MQYRAAPWINSSDGKSLISAEVPPSGLQAECEQDRTRFELSARFWSLKLSGSNKHLRVSLSFSRHEDMFDLFHSYIPAQQWNGSAVDDDAVTDIDEVLQTEFPTGGSAVGVYSQSEWESFCCGFLQRWLWGDVVVAWRFCCAQLLISRRLVNRAALMAGHRSAFIWSHDRKWFGLFQDLLFYTGWVGRQE